MSPSPTPNILVIGGGISGLACAHRLQKDGFAVQILESGRRFGGVLDTVEKDGFRFDIGPQSFLANAPMMALIEELGLAGELLRADPRAPRYILLKGKLVAAPLGPGSLIRTPLISWRTKLRLLAEPLSRSYPPDGDESIAAFIRRKFGEDVLTNLAGPFISGIYAGDPEKLSLTSVLPIARTLEEKFGSVIRGAIKMRRQAGGGPRQPRAPRPSLCNFRQGTPALVNALAAALADSARCAATVAAIRGNGPGQPARFTVTFQESGAMHSLTASAIVFATPARQAGALLSNAQPQFSDLLSQIEYAPVAQVAAGYRLSQISRFSAGANANAARGFGFLVPRTEGLRLLGTVWNSFLFAGRAPETPEKMASFTSFVGGATDPEICARPENEIAALVHKELAAVLGIGGEPVVQHVAKWQRALPQYNLGHASVVAALGELCAATPGIFLTGNYLAGPSMGACVDHANKTAAAVAQFLRAQA